MAKTKGASGFGWLRKAQVKDRINGGKRWTYYASYLNPFDKEERIKAPHAFDYKMDARQWLDAEHKLIKLGAVDSSQHKGESRSREEGGGTLPQDDIWRLRGAMVRAERQLVETENRADLQAAARPSMRGVS